MKNICLLDQMQQTIRVNVCAGCRICPEGKQQLGPEVMRACETDCCLMRNLPALYDVAANIGVSRHYERAISDVCRTCQASPTAGDLCTRRFTRTCPLSVHGAEAIAALELLVVQPMA